MCLINFSRKKRGMIFELCFESDCWVKATIRKLQRTITLCLLDGGDRQLLFGTGKCRGKNRMYGKASAMNNPNTERSTALYRQRRENVPTAKNHLTTWEVNMAFLDKYAEHKNQLQETEALQCGICIENYDSSVLKPGEYCSRQWSIRRVGSLYE